MHREVEKTGNNGIHILVNLIRVLLFTHQILSPFWPDFGTVTKMSTTLENLQVTYTTQRVRLASTRFMNL